MDPAQLSPKQARELFRSGLRTPTSGFSPGYAQANLIALPREAAFDFLLFAQRNPKPCPVLDVTEPGQVSASVFDGDLRTDLPAYRVYRHGELVEERADVTDLWRDDLVAFLIGCSFTFETPLLEAGVPVRHTEAGTNVAMYRTNRECRPAGRFRGPLVVSMRPIPADRVADAVRITSRYPAVHGAPVHVGDPAALGIADLSRPDYGDPVEVREGEVPVFWACGVTPQAAVAASAPEFAIGHAPGHMAVTDVRDSYYQVP
ncbi:putative hydro-lyase [Nocardiopsis changdeensis]|uniref:Putative hydro-lyase KGD84_06920 n=1 Tax=Nocardiopsis changdeensis TaxID=2831969 RepID=A0ABX8BPG3_9ACTN|nr:MULTISPECIES: putative hydro-lyase [Nocardiopsis]QUX24046.1 putative hydro-lyase [Nocardiopsis changdeensis]QYX34442.1 putative hydro-lyase [Nocardiopsis sp. MT53]